MLPLALENLQQGLSQKCNPTGMALKYSQTQWATTQNREKVKSLFKSVIRLGWWGDNLSRKPF